MSDKLSTSTPNNRNLSLENLPRPEGTTGAGADNGSSITSTGASGQVIEKPIDVVSLMAFKL